MINFKKESAYKKLMKVILEEEPYYNGSFFETSDLSQLLEIVYDTQNKKEK